MINRTVKPKAGDLIRAVRAPTVLQGGSEVFGLYEQRFEKRRIGHMPSFTYQLLVDCHLREFDSEIWTFTVVNSCQKKYYKTEGSQNAKQ